MSEKATSGSSQTRDPLPNTVCVANDIFSGSLDALAYDERTQFRNGTALVMNCNGGESYSIALCSSRHLHLNVGLKTELGFTSVLAVAAYALALTFDREAWIAGWVPDTQRLEDAFVDCINVMRDRGTPQYADWLIENATPVLNDWCKHLRESARVLTPHADVEA